MAALPLGIIRINPAVIVEDDPERLSVDHGQICYDRHQHILLAFVMKRARQMMVIYHVVLLVRTDHNGNHVPAEQFSACAFP